jgi:hypothetical protein
MAVHVFNGLDEVRLPQDQVQVVRVSSLTILISIASS